MTTTTAENDLEKLKIELASSIREFPDFPQKGILFKDIMPIFQKPQLVTNMCVAIAAHAVAEIPVPVDAVAGLEARGFLFGPQIAAILNVPFIPIRKQGKLPGKTVRATYVKEYGEDVVEVQSDALKPGAKVMIVDDLLATGGTMKAAIEVIQKAGGDVAEAFCIIELTALKGRDVLLDTVPVFTLLSF
uniref:Adenine phosphoribosyltransferase n=1 Tax=Plectus sambesii TaxID=2011161 RepID=A0A914VMP0_9BILA